MAEVYANPSSRMAKSDVKHQPRRKARVGPFPLRHIYVLFYGKQSKGGADYGCYSGGYWDRDFGGIALHRTDAEAHRQGAEPNRRLEKHSEEALFLSSTGRSPHGLFLFTREIHRPL